MTETGRNTMAPEPMTLPQEATVSDAARLMRDRDAGSIIVLHPDSSLCGVVTERDIVVRAVAEGRAPESTRLDSVCTHVSV